MLGLLCEDMLILSVCAGATEQEPDSQRPRSLESCDCFSRGDQAATVEESSAEGTSTRSASRSAASFLSSSTPTAETAGIPKLPNCMLGWRADRGGTSARRW